MDSIRRPVTLRSEAFPAVRVVGVAQPTTPTSGGAASRVEHVTLHRHEFTDDDGKHVATAYCRPDVAQVMLAGLNAADPDAAVRDVDQVQVAIDNAPVSTVRRDFVMSVGPHPWEEGPEPTDRRYGGYAPTAF
jgi:hypothetical protein